jgi:hypothetical protein
MNKEFINIVEGLQSKLADADLELKAVVARNLWFRRNSVIYGAMYNHPS